MRVGLTLLGAELRALRVCEHVEVGLTHRALSFSSIMGCGFNLVL